MMNRLLNLLTSSCGQISNSSTKFLSTSSYLNYIQLKTRLRVVDNSTLGKEASDLGKPAYCIRVYNKRDKGKTGDKILVAIRGQKKKAYVVGCKLHDKPGIPKFESNNIVLINDDGTPIGTRILVPVPSYLRGIPGDISKVLAIATKFV